MLKKPRILSLMRIKTRQTETQYLRKQSLYVQRNTAGKSKPLRPRNDVHKALISTPCRFIGEFERDLLYVGHAWPQFRADGMARRHEGPSSRYAFTIVFKKDYHSVEAPNFLPADSDLPLEICSYLSLLFGKRFDDHGHSEFIGLYRLPDLSQFGELCNFRLPFCSNAERSDFTIPLNLSELGRLDRLLFDESLDQKLYMSFSAASKFYMRALQVAERDPEIAYLHLITAGEILANYYSFPSDALLDDQAKTDLQKLEQASPEFAKIARNFRGRLRQIKRAFKKTILTHVQPSFFDTSECQDEFGRFKSEDFEARIGAAYDLRSKYVHTGIPFGGWVYNPGRNWEVQVGKPVVSDPEYGKILAKAPTLLGMERVMRYCLLHFAQVHGLCIIDS